MLAPEFEAKVRKWVEEYQGTDRGQLPVDTVALLLAEIDRLRFQVQLLEKIAATKREIENDLEGWTDHD